MRVSVEQRFAPVFMRVLCRVRVEGSAASGFPVGDDRDFPCTISGHGLVDELHLVDSM